MRERFTFSSGTMKYSSHWMNNGCKENKQARSEVILILSVCLNAADLLSRCRSDTELPVYAADL